MPDNAAASTEEAELREQKKRTYEIRAALGIAVFVVTCSWLQLAYYGMDSWMFIALFNINIILMLAALFLVARNIIKLMIERRRKVFGSHIRSRMVGILVMLMLIPTIIIFIASNKIVSTSVDYWFTTHTENALQAALDVGQTFYQNTRETLKKQTEAVADSLLHRLEGPDFTFNEILKLLDTAREETDLRAVALATRDGHILASSRSHTEPTWQDIRSAVNWNEAEWQNFHTISLPDETADYITGIMPIDGSMFLVSVKYIGKGQFARLERISNGFTEYARLKQLKNPLKVSLRLILGILAMFTLFGATWYGFRLSKEFTAPLLALCEGTNRIAKGDLSFRLTDEGSDELAQLVKSFNQMAQDLQIGSEQLTQANMLLAKQNTVMDERRRYIEAVLENITTAVITLDAAGRLQTINKAACATFHTAADILYGRTPDTFLPPMYAPVFFDMIDCLRDHKIVRWQRQLDFIMRGRTWKLAVNAVALRNEKQAVQTYIIAIEDITELEKMQRMAAWREVARRIAHEIKNPLTPIKLSAQRLSKKFGSGVSDPAFSQCTDLIVNQSERLQTMVQDFSAFAKMPEITPKLGHIEPVLDNLITMFSTSHPHIAWEQNIQNNIPPLFLDNDAIYRALFNLLSNAAEAIESMDADQKPEHPTVKITAAVSDTRRVCITIADSGPGLTPEELNRMFEPYFSRKKGGMGLGLAIVKTIISDHHGTIDASATAAGTTLTVNLPLPEFTQDQDTISA